MRCRWASLVLVMLATHIARASEPVAPDVIDRWRDAGTIPAGTVSLEAEALVDENERPWHNRHGATLHTKSRATEGRIRIGIAERFEIRLGCGEEEVEEEIRGTGSLVDGVSKLVWPLPMRLGLKVTPFGDVGDRFRFALAVDAAVRIGANVHLGVVGMSFEPSMFAAIAQRFDESLTLGGTIGVAWNPDSLRPGALASIMARANLYDALTVRGEITGAAAHGDIEASVEGCVAYRIWPGLQVELFGAKAIVGDAADVSAGLGLWLGFPWWN